MKLNERGISCSLRPTHVTRTTENTSKDQFLRKLQCCMFRCICVPMYIYILPKQIQIAMTKQSHETRKRRPGHQIRQNMHP